MKKNILYITILLVLGASAIYLKNKPSGNTDEFEREMFRADTLRMVSAVFEKGNEKAVLKKGVNSWFVEGRKNFPADPDAVNNLLKYATEINLINIISENPERHFRFGVDSTGTLVKFRMNDNSEKEFIIGADDQERRHSFYRKKDGATVYLGTLFPRYRLSAVPEDWRDRAVTKVDRNSIIKLTLSQGKNIVELTKDGDSWTGTYNGKSKDPDREKIEKLIGMISGLRSERFEDDIEIDSTQDPLTVKFLAGADIHELILSVIGDKNIVFHREKKQAYAIKPDLYASVSELIKQ